MKEEEIMMLNAQQLELPDDHSPRYDFSKCEILTSNFGPEGYSSKIKKVFKTFKIMFHMKEEEVLRSVIREHRCLIDY